jgi:Na+-transporting methylmalonyl-CoA/oxaloacetate decarboxylase gamma subunit
LGWKLGIPKAHAEDEIGFYLTILGWKLLVFCIFWFVLFLFLFNLYGMGTVKNSGEPKLTSFVFA